MLPAGDSGRGGVYAALSFFLAYLVCSENVAGHKGVLNRGPARIRGLKLAGSSSSNEAFLLDLETTTGIGNYRNKQIRDWKSAFEQFFQDSGHSLRQEGARERS